MTHDLAFVSSPTPLRSTRSLEPGVEVVVIGDVHGRSDAFAVALDLAGSLPRKEARRTLVLLGDLIDRGPDSIGAWRLAGDAARLAKADEVVDLMGNHEQMAAMALARPDNARGLTPRVIGNALEVWGWNGGDAVLASLVATTGADLDDDEAISRALRAELGPRLVRMRSHWRCGDTLFVHAGVNPDVPLDRMLAAPWVQFYPRMVEAEHWAWVRDPFLRAEVGEAGHHGTFVVHGHSPRGGIDMVPDETAVRAHSRLNLDGGSYATGIVRLAVMSGSDILLHDIVGEAPQG